MLCIFIIIEIKLIHSWASLGAQMANNPPAMWETATQGCNVPSLGWEDLLEEGMALPVFLPGESLCTVGPGGLQSMRPQKVRHD